MLSRSGNAMLLVLAAAAVAAVHAADIEGEVVIRRKLSRRTVTAPAGAYQRGLAVKPAPPDDDDPLAFERTHVVIYLEGPLPSEPVEATLEQKNRRFIPDLLVVPAGSEVSFPNRDPIFHNVFSLSKSKTFDLGNYPKDQTRTVKLPKAGVVYVNCHLHPNMSAAIFVTPNRWSTRPDTSGRFILSDVPAGKHRIVAWHKAAGFFRQTVDVRPGNRPTVSFVIPFDEDGSVSMASER
jgi:plastocyanin